MTQSVPVQSPINNNKDAHWPHRPCERDRFTNRHKPQRHPKRTKCVAAAVAETLTYWIDRFCWPRPPSNRRLLTYKLITWGLSLSFSLSVYRMSLKICILGSLRVHNHLPSHIATRRRATNVFLIFFFSFFLLLLSYKTPHTRPPPTPI